MRFTAPVLTSLLFAAAACSASPQTPAPGSAATSMSTSKPGQTSVAGPTSPTPDNAPTLGEAFQQHTRGYGQVRPGVVDAGGSGTSVVTDLMWATWGGPQATGTGRATYVPPGQANAAGHPEAVDITAADLGRCPDGRLAYRAVTWTFPAHPDAERAEFSDICG